MIDFDAWASGLDERIERDIDYIRDEEEQNRTQVITGYANPDGSGNGNWLFCAKCSFLIEAHWHTDERRGRHSCRQGLPGGQGR